MTALCHAEFALTEADYYLGALGSEENARVAYDDYLVGHARWFRGSGGRRLLDAISQWAEQAAEKLGPEGGGGFNPCIRPIESSGPLQAAEKPLRGSKKCQGTTSVVPQMQQNKERALAPEGCFLEFRHGIRPFSAACETRERHPRKIGEQ
jgi:hypothetical protein